MKIGLVSCSNGLLETEAAKMNQLIRLLEDGNIRAETSNCLYAKASVGQTEGQRRIHVPKGAIRSGSPKERAEALMHFYRDSDMSMICDVSGGDIANEILPYLDYDLIQSSSAVFAGYSDLTTVLNAIYTKTGKPGILYQVRHLLAAENEEQRQAFQEYMLQRKQFSIPNYYFIQGNGMQGILVGGNIRCLLKLAGTEYFPDMQGKILLLEAMSGDVAKMITYLAQLKQLGVFDRIQGILLGTFTQMERERQQPTIEELVLEYAGEDIPVAKTMEVGHGIDAKPVWIGIEYQLKKYA